MSNYKPFAFVLMPFDSGFSDIYHLGIKETAEKLGVVAERVDEQHFSETILERVYRQIENSDFVIAEMTGKNPNVFYEVGYAHAKGKKCALITQSADDIPFDLKHHSHVIYDGSVSDLRMKLAPRIEWMVTEAEKSKAETISVEAAAVDGFLEKGDYFHHGTFDMILTLRNESIRRSPEIEAIHVKTKDLWSLSVNGSECPSIPDDKKGKNKNLIAPRLVRLSPNAFSQERVTFRRRLWSKFSGEEEQESYASKGIVTVDIVTSEGTLSYDLPLEIVFTEIPF